MSIALTLPPDARHLGVLRATVGAAAARAPMTIDQIDDVRLATEEAAALLLPQAPEGLTVRFDVSEPAFAVELRAVCDGPVSVDQQSLAGLVLNALTESFSVGLEGDETVLRLRFGAAVVDDGAES